MAIRTILFHATADQRSAVRLETAVDLARRHDALLVGLYVMPLNEVPGPVQAYLSADMLERRRKEAAAVAADAKAAFEERCRRDGVVAEWRQGDGEPFASLVDQARYADVVVVGQAEPDVTPPSFAALPEDLALSSGRPALAIPYAGRFPSIGNRILIAWNRTREATRAAHDALPLLVRAKAVIVLAVNPPDSNGHATGADLCAHLARHGVKAEAQHTIARGIDVADALLDSVSDSGADLLVMGAYGHSRIREYALGGVTRSILRQMTVPVLMAH